MFVQKVNSTQIKLMGIISVDSDVTDQILVKYFQCARYWRKTGEYNGAVYQLFIDFKKASAENLCTTFSFNLVYSMKLVRLTKIHINKIYNKSSCRKYLIHFLFIMV
jgi:hypothetical protein